MLLVNKVHHAVEKTFDTTSYLLLQKNGPESGQAVSHVHIHYIPRQAGDRSVPKFLFRMFYAAACAPITPEEMQTQVERLKENI